MKTNLGNVGLEDYSNASGDFAAAMIAVNTSSSRCEAKLREIVKAMKKGRDTDKLIVEWHATLKDMAAQLNTASEKAKTASDAATALVSQLEAD